MHRFADNLTRQVNGFFLVMFHTHPHTLVAVSYTITEGEKRQKHTNGDHRYPADTGNTLYECPRVEYVPHGFHDTTYVLHLCAQLNMTVYHTRVVNGHMHYLCYMFVENAVIKTSNRKNNVNLILNLT